MAEFGSEPTFGERVKAIRRARGFKSARALAASIEGGTLTESIIENIEAGRREDITVSQLLNLSHALEVPPTYLLAPIASPDRQLDLANLSAAFDGMNAGEFDSWLASTTGDSYRAETPDEQRERRTLELYRELVRLSRESQRVAASASLDNLDSTWGERAAALDAEVARLRTFLRAAGWNVPN